MEPAVRVLPVDDVCANGGSSVAALLLVSHRRRTETDVKSPNGNITAVEDHSPFRLVNLNTGYLIHGLSPRSSGVAGTGCNCDACGRCQHLKQRCRLVEVLPSHGHGALKAAIPVCMGPGMLDSATGVPAFFGMPISAVHRPPLCRFP